MIPYIHIPAAGTFRVAQISIRQHRFLLLFLRDERYLCKLWKTRPIKQPILAVCKISPECKGFPVLLNHTCCHLLKLCRARRWTCLFTARNCFLYPPHAPENPAGVCQRASSRPKSTKIIRIRQDGPDENPLQSPAAGTDTVCLSW